MARSVAAAATLVRDRLQRSRPRLRPRSALARRLVVVLAVLGPGLIAANAGNDAGGIATYASVGAKYGYDLLWMMVLITVSLVVVQEMAARMGAVTGKGLAELIREQYGVRWSLFATASVLLAAVGVWLLVVRGSYKTAERVFVLMTIPFFAYPIAAILARPHWGSVGKAIVAPHVQLSSGYLFLFIATAGTTITPFMQLYVQSAVVERGIGPDELNAERAEVAAGSLFANLVASFIIIATGATLFVHGDRTVNSAADAARALEPFAGRFAEVLFAVGLLGASLLAAAILPVTAAYVIAETFGFEKGISHRAREAPVFVGVITTLIVVGSLVAIVPGLPVIRLLVAVQVVNGVLLPVTLFFVWRLASNRELMGSHANGRAFNVLAGATVLATSGLSLLLLGVTFSGSL